MTEILVESIKTEDHSECQNGLVIQHQDESSKQQSTGEMKSDQEQQSVEQQSNIPVLSNDRVNRQNGHINVEEFLRKQLHNTPRDRSFMLNVEEELIAFLKTPSKEHYKFDPMNPYYRMLVHRIGDYFNLGHQVDQAKLSVIVTKTDKSKIPEISFREMIKSFEGVEESDASDSNANGSHEVDVNGTGASLLEKKPSSSSLTDQPEGMKKQILKREVNSSVALHSSQQGDLTRNGFGKRAPEVKTKTYEEKSAEYIRVKNRIFNTQTTTTSNNSYDPSRMTVLNRQSENGRNGGYNQSKPIYNNKTRQNGGAYVTPRQYSNQNNNVAQFNSPLPNGNNASASNTASVATAATSTNVSMVLNMSYLQQFPVQGGQMYQTMMHPQYTSHLLPQQQTNLANQPSMIYNGNGMGVSNGQQPYKLMQHLNMPPSMAPVPPVSQNNGPWPQQSMAPPPTLESLQFGYPPTTQNVLNSQYLSSTEMTNPKSSMNQANSHLYYAMYANQLAAGQQQAASQPIQHHQMFTSQMKQPIGHFPIPNGATGGDQTIMDNYHSCMMPTPANSFINPASMPPASNLMQTYNGAVNHQQTKFIQAGGQHQPHALPSNSSNVSSAAYLPPSISHNVINSTSSYRNNNNYKNGPNMSISQKQMPRSMTHSFNNNQSSYNTSYNAQRGRNMPRFGRPSRNYSNGSVYSANHVGPRNHTDELTKSANSGACIVQLFDIKGDLASKSALSELLGPYALSIDVRLKSSIATDNNEKNGVNLQTEIINEDLVDVFVSFESEEKLRQALSNGFNMNEELFQTMIQQPSSDIHDDQLPFRLKSLTIE